MAHKDRKLIKKPKPLRVDDYLHDFIAASANMAGVSWSEMARLMLEEAAQKRIAQIAPHLDKHKQAERI